MTVKNVGVLIMIWWYFCTAAQGDSTKQSALLGQARVDFRKMYILAKRYIVFTCTAPLLG